MSTWTPSTRRSSSAMMPELRGKPVAVGGAPARRGHGGELRGAHVRRALGHAVGDRQAALRRAGVRKAALRGLQGSVAPDPRDLPRLHAAGRTAVARRGLSRRHRPTSRACRWRSEIAREIRARIFERTGLTASAGISYNKFLGQARLRPSQAQRPDGDPAREGSGLRRRPAGGQVPRRRPEDGGKDEPPRHP